MRKIPNRFKKLYQDQISIQVINISEIRKGKQLALENRDSINSVEELVGRGISPSDALYFNMQSLTSVLLEGLIQLPPAASMYRFFIKQEDLYEPGYPPHSPITNSYYNLWLQYDAAFRDDNETIGSCILDMADLLQINDLHKTALENLCRSRMGIYEIARMNADGSASVSEFLTQKKFEVKFDVHFSGQSGDIVYSRILPNLLGLDVYTAFGVPYQLVGYAENEWVNYFKKYGVEQGSDNFELKYYSHIKYSEDRNYWIEFTFWAYMQHRPDVIYLTGLPDDVSTQAAHQKFNAQKKYLAAYREIELRLNRTPAARNSSPMFVI